MNDCVGSSYCGASQMRHVFKHTKNSASASITVDFGYKGLPLMGDDFFGPFVQMYVISVGNKGHSDIRDQLTRSRAVPYIRLSNTYICVQGVPVRTHCIQVE